MKNTFLFQNLRDHIIFRLAPSATQEDTDQVVIKTAPNVQKISGRYVDERTKIRQILGVRKKQEKEIKKVTSDIEEAKSNLDKMELFKEIFQALSCF